MIDPKQIQKLMQQMGITTSEIDAKRVIIEKDNEKVILNEPKILVIEAKGEKTFQITSNKIEIVPIVTEEDIKLVMEKTGASREECKKALLECKGDIAEAILKLGNRMKS